MTGSAVRFLFRLIWGRWLPGARIISATSWRRGTVEFPSGQRMRGTMCLRKSNDPAHAGAVATSVEPVVGGRHEG